MSRSGYTDDNDDNWLLIRWRGAVTSAIRGKKGQAFLSELLAALDAMPEKALIAQSFAVEGAYCTLGVVCASRGVSMPHIDPDDWEADARQLARDALKIPDALAAEIMYHNDEGSWSKETPEGRWSRMREWVADNIAAKAHP